MEEIALAFGWREWPFRIVADVQFARLWADRASLRAELERRLRRLYSVPHSTVQILWADFGAGKSHTLRYLQARCLDDPKGRLVPIYTEVPVGTGGLIDLYRSLVGSIPPELLAELGKRVNLENSGGKIGTAGARDLSQALKLFSSDDASSRSIAVEWLQATPGVPHLKALKAFGISARIEDDTRVVEVIASLISLLRETRGEAGILWLVDEFQRVADVPPRKRDSFAKSIVSLFNSCPNGLHFALSFSVAQQSTALALIPPDLRSRASTFPMLLLAHLSRGDAVQFARDLFTLFRNTQSPDADFPFTEDALEAVVEDLDNRTNGAITPRVLMERLESILFEGYDMNDGAPELPLSKSATNEIAKLIAARDQVAE